MRERVRNVVFDFGGVLLEWKPSVSGFRMSETAFVDDHEPNVAAAKKFGFATVLFNDPDACAAELYDALGLRP